MNVRVRDRATEAATWGKPGYHITLRTVTIPDTCPVCGGPRGEPKATSYHEDGETFSVDVWENACGHIDSYADVLREGAP
jgi:hypothetical protein